MGRRHKEAAKMGRTLIKNRFKGKSVSGGDSFLHTTELNDGYEGSSMNLQSVTETTSMADFLMTAEMAGRDFTAEKENVQIVTPQLNSGILSAEEQRKVKETQELHKNLLCIPRRPPWEASTSADQLRHDEHMAFLEWRRSLVSLQEKEHIVVTPYEKNLEFWRQLWRVLERSDVVVQIVDARNPLLFWCSDVDKYVKEVNPEKETLLLVNKADLLTENQRIAWAKYFASKGVNAVFWSAVEEGARLENAPTKDSKPDEDDANDEDDEIEEDDASNEEDVIEEGDGLDEDVVNDEGNVNIGNEDVRGDDVKEDGERSDTTDKDDVIEDSVVNKEEDDANDEDNVNVGGDDNRGDDVKKADEQSDTTEEVPATQSCKKDIDDSAVNDSERPEPENDAGSKEHQSSNSQTAQATCVTENSTLVSTEELLSLFKHTARTQHQAGVTTVGMVGYPNVGKSSTINTILRTKKVAVSATPGRTKHFQTLYVDKELMLCDCPGLVFPSFVNSKADLVVNGILPIDQLHDSEPPVDLVCHRVGRSALETLYHLNFPPAEESEDADKAPSAYDLLQAYGALRGFMSHKGNPDRPRAARCILKDFVNGKLLYCHPPPGIDAAAFQRPPYGAPPRTSKPGTRATDLKTESELKTERLDREFFSQRSRKAHVKGPHAVTNYVRTEGLRVIGAGDGSYQISQESLRSSGESPSSAFSSQASLQAKPSKKHHNRNKKEKLRKVYKDLDQY